ncbi:MAG: 3-methyl-2-oxobutanoate hydroxymethyltransferase [Methylacidiphilales bacterium]|nr:3-methyl-2-oxobutanoate hydroxymethyltransferase [Candidatus Methylacidiphilales bacterium]MDW8349989.1 3-methyl-2-oxobutanoate hydroxymethyltransferase [Verrucomicrobiae bacterium]
MTTSFPSDRLTPQELRSYKNRRSIAALTCYDYPTARLLDEVGVPLLLVGDSLGMVVLGYPDTTEVTLAEMIHHTRAVARARTRALIVADLPKDTYNEASQAIQSARALLQAGADAVKLEGGRSRAVAIQALAGAGIPFMGHLGMLPQSIKEEGRYRIKGRTDAERRAILADAHFLEEQGAFAIVLELVVADLAAEIRRALKIPTIGIGSGEDCDGQILVLHDLIGLYPWFRPRFAHPLADVAAEIKNAARAFMQGVQSVYERLHQ